jgi:hypothetical protein
MYYHAERPCLEKKNKGLVAADISVHNNSLADMPSPDIQPVRDNDAGTGDSSFFHDGYKEASRYIVNEVIGRGR